MKKILLIMISFFISSFVYATDISLDNMVITFPDVSGYGMQGFTTVKDKLFISFVDDNETRSLIRIYDLNNYTLLKEMEGPRVGHANDVTYNSKTNEVLVVHADGTNIVSIFDGDTFEFKKQITIPLPIRSMTYIDDEDGYAVRTIANGFILKNNYTLRYKIPFIIGMDFSFDVGRQGWSYYKGFIYYSTWSWIRYGGDGTNTIFVYDVNGHLRDRLHIKEGIGELENVSFYNNKMILGLNGYEGKAKFYVEDIPVVPNLVIDEEPVKEITPEKNSNIFYIVIALGLIIIPMGFIAIKKLHV